MAARMAFAARSTRPCSHPTATGKHKLAGWRRSVPDRDGAADRDRPAKTDRRQLPDCERAGPAPYARCGRTLSTIMRDFARMQRWTWLAAVPAESGIALLCGILLTFFGPFYTSTASLAYRLVYWVGLSLAWLVISRMVELALASSARLRGLASWQRRGLSLAIGSIPMTGLAAVATRRLEGATFTTGELALLYVQVAAVCASVSFAIEAVAVRSSRPAPGSAAASRAPGGAPAATQDDAGSDAGTGPEAERPAKPRVLLRLPPAQRGRLRCLSGEDHYVRIHTDRGAPLVLMRFRDALEELDGLPGERVHRSWWVAGDEPCTFTRTGRTAVLRLADDLTVPVSTPYLGAAEALAHARA